MDINFQLDKLINIIYSLNGSIFGESVREYNIINKLLNNNNETINFDNINIIFNNNTIITYFIRILSFNYEVYKEINENSKVITYNLICNYIFNNTYNTKIIKINMISQTQCRYYKNKIIDKLTYALDCNQFFSNSYSIYLNTNKILLSSNITRYTNFNTFNIYYNRIRNNKFSFIRKDINFTKYIQHIDKAYELIINNWIMDDYHNFNIHKSSVLFRWKNRNNKNYRLYYSTEDYNKLLTYDNCAICGRDFTDDCIIINTSCNHNFHWYCGEKCGLKHWIQYHNNNCPICRLTEFI